MQAAPLLWLALSDAAAGIGSHRLTDASGLVYTIVNNSGASGAITEASYPTSVAASTVSSGTTSMRLSDAFDGYGSVFVDGTRYSNNGPGTFECDDRQLVFETQAMGDLTVWRKLYVPEDDAFARMLLFVRNDGASDVTTTAGFLGNVGSDSWTLIMADSSGDAVVDVKDDWAVSMQAFTHHSWSTDPRLGHVWQNGFGSVVADELTLRDGNDTVHWRFTIDVPAGATVGILTFVTGQPTVAAAQLQAETLVTLPPTARACMTADEWDSIINFGIDCSHLDDQCNAGTFDKVLDDCAVTAANEGGTCDDGDACTAGDVCGGGTCAGTVPAEVTGDGVDQDCDGGEVCWSDADDDGHAAETGATVASKDADCDDPFEASGSDPADDCDDGNPGAYPGATEIADDGVDQDCDGSDLVEKATDDSGGAGKGDDGGDDGGDDPSDDAGGEPDGGCGCAARTGPPAIWALVLGLVALARRARRSPRGCDAN
jgi:hypothetical protein